MQQSTSFDGLEIDRQLKLCRRLHRKIPHAKFCVTRGAGPKAKLSIYGKNAPLSGNALERMLALIDE